MARHDNALQGVMLVALLVLFPMTIQLLVHQDESPLWRTVYVEVDSDEEEDAEARSESRNREDVARIATFNIKIFGETKMGKADVVSELVNISLRYDMVVVQEIKDLDQTVPYDFLDAINAESNDTYGLVLSQRSGQQDDDQGGQEQYAFYYKTSRFIAQSSWLHNDSELDEFQREPFISTFTLLSNNGSEIEDITLITVHTKPAQAVNETASLHNVVETYRTNSSESDIILLGDFNADCSYASTYDLNQLEIRSHEYLWVVPDSADTTYSENTHCAYDRIVLTSDVDARFFGKWGVDRNMSSSDVSDHFPVWFDLDIREDVQE